MDGGRTDEHLGDGEDGRERNKLLQIKEIKVRLLGGAEESEFMGMH